MTGGPGDGVITAVIFVIALYAVSGSAQLPLGIELSGHGAMDTLVIVAISISALVIRFAGIKAIGTKVGDAQRTAKPVITHRGM